MEHFLDLHVDDDCLLTKCIIEMAEMVLSKKYLLFENLYYLQIESTVMGATMAPDYANLYNVFFGGEICFQK